MARSEAETVELIIEVVLEIIESEGHEAVQLRRVARQSHLSFTTIYALFPARDHLILRAIQTWMARNSWSELGHLQPGSSLYDSIRSVLRAVFLPWEEHPNPLRAYHYARTSPIGNDLDVQAAEVFAPLMAVITRADTETLSYLKDVQLVLTDLTFAAIGKFAQGDLEATDILPLLERALFRLTANNQPHAAAVESLALRLAR